MYVRPSSSFRKGHTGPSFCKSIGRGRHEVSLEVGAGQCGWKREGQKVTLDLYVQYDAHVQQVIDEQISVECNMATREGRLVMLYGGEGMSVPVQSTVQSYQVGQSLVNKEQEEKAIEDTEKDIDTSAPVIAKRGRMSDAHVRVMGWLDITEGSIHGGKSISRPLEEGEYVMIAAKVKQVEGMGTMMTRCGMEDGKGKVTVLTDERGCSLDREMVGDVQTKYNEATKVKEMFTNFQVPKFEVSGHLTIKCGVVVCDGDCPVSPCDEKDDPIDMIDMIVMETEAAVRQGEAQELSAAAVSTTADSHSYNMIDMIQVTITSILIMVITKHIIFRRTPSCVCHRLGLSWHLGLCFLFLCLLFSSPVFSG